MDDPTVLGADLRRIATDGGADLFGVADLTPVRAFIEEQGGPFIAAFPRAVSVAMRLSPAMVEQVVDHKNAAPIRSYRHYVYEVVNPDLDQISGALTRRLVQAGYRAYLVSASQTVDKERLCGVFSHKLAAHLAGLGHIGKACLLVTERYGARVRFGTVLTDAPLPITNSLTEEERARARTGCGDCNRCVEICPVHAYAGVEFRPEDPRDVRFRAHVCDRYLEHREKTLGARACALCVIACDGSQWAAAGG